MNKTVKMLFLAGAAFVLGYNYSYAKEIWKMTFDDCKEGEIAPGFVASSGQWIVVKEKTPSGKMNGYLFQGQSDSRNNPVVTFAKGGDLKDVSMQVRFRVEKKGSNQTIGIILKHRGESDYLSLVLSISEGSMRLIRTEQGKTSVLAKAAVSMGANTWHRLQLFTKDDRLSCSLNNQKIIQAKDKALDAKGKIGLATYGDTIAAFDNMSLVKLD